MKFDTRTRSFGLLALASAVALGACAPEAEDTAELDSDFDEETEMASATDAESADDVTMERTGETMTLTVNESAPYGEFVATMDGRPVYLFTADAHGESSACYDGCAEAWPPVTGEIEAGEGIDEALIGTISREDGTLQATYNGWPLYEFARDERNAAPQGQDVRSFGGEWYLVTPEGTEIHSTDRETEKETHSG